MTLVLPGRRCTPATGPPLAMSRTTLLVSSRVSTMTSPTASITGRFTFDRLPEAIAGLNFALDEMKACGAAVSERGRLQQHLELLETLRKDGTYPPIGERRPVVAQAIEDAAQFSFVAPVLPERPVATLVNDLRRAAKGSGSRESDGNREPHQFQSQLFFGSLLAAAGTRSWSPIATVIQISSPRTGSHITALRSNDPPARGRSRGICRRHPTR